MHAPLLDNPRIFFRPRHLPVPPTIHAPTSLLCACSQLSSDGIVTAIPAVVRLNFLFLKGYHYLMRLAHLLNTLARFSKELTGLFSTLGVQAAIGFIRNTLTGPWLDPRAIEERLNQPFRLRLV